MNLPKYKIGDKVWILSAEKAAEKTVCGILLCKLDREDSKKQGAEELFRYELEFGKLYSSSSFFYKEAQLFPTKESLIQSL